MNPQYKDAKYVYLFNIDGQPVPKGRPRFGKGRTYTPAKTLAAEILVAWEVKQVFDKPLEGDIKMDITFRVKGKRRGDIDNLQKLILDGCNKIAFLDDKQVVHLTSRIIQSDDPETIFSIERFNN